VEEATALNDVFAANRAAGRIALSVAAMGGRTRRLRVYEDGPLRVRFPSAAPDALEAMIVNTAGGIAGGDRHDLDIGVGQGAALGVTTAAAEKVYRAHGSRSAIAIKLAVGEDALLNWLPQETILFDQARLDRRLDVELARSAKVVMAEAVVFGRSAMDETVEQGAFNDRWRVRRDGTLIFAETIRLDGAIAQMLREPAVAGGGVAIGTVLAAPGDQDMVDRLRARTFCGEVAASSWNGLAVARLCAKDSASLRRDLAVAFSALSGTLPRLWLN